MLVSAIQYSGLAWCTIGIACWMLIYALAAWTFHRRLPAQPMAAAQPPVTIVVLASGLEPELERNLTSILDQDYPDFRVVFSIATQNDAARPAIERSLRKFPGLPARLQIGELSGIADPQIRNYLAALETVTDELVLVADSNVALRPDTLRRLVAYMTPDVGIVSALPVAVRPHSVGASFECAILNGMALPYFILWSALAQSHLVARMLRPFGILIGIRDSGFPHGKCMLYRYNELRAANGLERLRHGMFWDLTAAEVLRKQGLRTVNPPFLTEHPVGNRSIAATFSRHRRWTIGAAQFMFPVAYMDLLGSPILLSAAGAVGASAIGLNAAAAVFITFFAFIAAAAIQHHACGIALRASFPLMMTGGYFLRFAAILVGLTCGVTEWRGQPFKITRTTQRNSAKSADRALAE